MRTATTLLLIISVYGCASTENYRELAELWIGHHQDELIETWGPPDSSFELDSGGVAYTWHEQLGNSFVPVGSSVVTTSRECSTTYYVDMQGRIYNVSFRGNACKI